MTVNPVDMQVILPQTGQVNRLQRGLQQQQQTEQKVLGQTVQQENRLKEQNVNKYEQTRQKKIDDQNREDQKRQGGGKKKAPDQEGQAKPGVVPGEEKQAGSLVDIKI